MEYKILKLVGELEMQKTVNRLIERGWEPLGGIAVVVDHHTEYLYQALVRRQPDDLRYK